MVGKRPGAWKGWRDCKESPPEWERQGWRQYREAGFGPKSLLLLLLVRGDLGRRDVGHKWAQAVTCYS